jgi:hypothetical protein
MRKLISRVLFDNSLLLDLHHVRPGRDGVSCITSQIVNIRTEVIAAQTYADPRFVKFFFLDALGLNISQDWFEDRVVEVAHILDTDDSLDDICAPIFTYFAERDHLKGKVPRITILAFCVMATFFQELADDDNRIRFAPLSPPDLWIMGAPYLFSDLFLPAIHSFGYHASDALHGSHYLKNIERLSYDVSILSAFLIALDERCFPPEVEYADPSSCDDWSDVCSKCSVVGASDCFCSYLTTDLMVSIGLDIKNLEPVFSCHDILPLLSFDGLVYLIEHLSVAFIGSLVDFDLIVSDVILSAAIDRLYDCLVLLVSSTLENDDKLCFILSVYMRIVSKASNFYNDKMFQFCRLLIRRCVHSFSMLERLQGSQVDVWNVLAPEESDYFMSAKRFTDNVSFFSFKVVSRLNLSLEVNNLVAQVASCEMYSPLSDYRSICESVDINSLFSDNGGGHRQFGYNPAIFVSASDRDKKEFVVIQADPELVHVFSMSDVLSKVVIFSPICHSYEHYIDNGFHWWWSKWTFPQGRHSVSFVFRGSTKKHAKFKTDIRLANFIRTRSLCAYGILDKYIDAYSLVSSMLWRLITDGYLFSIMLFYTSVGYINDFVASYGDSGYHFDSDGSFDYFDDNTWSCSARSSEFFCFAVFVGDVLWFNFVGRNTGTTSTPIDFFSAFPFDWLDNVTKYIRGFQDLIETLSSDDYSCYTTD